MAVTISDPHSPGKTSRFVGLCIDRGGHGLKAFFVLRNVVDGLGKLFHFKNNSSKMCNISPYYIGLKKRHSGH